MEAAKLKKSLKVKLVKFIWVTHPQRRTIANLLNVSRPTIDNYINGKVCKLEFAERLLKVLNKVQKPQKIKL
jgi:predicted XRE-type DNA-binding protein